MDKLCGRTTNTKSPLKSQMETYYHIVLKYEHTCTHVIYVHIHVWTWNLNSHCIMEEIISQLDTLCHQVKFPVPKTGYILLSCFLKGSHRTSSPNITNCCQGYLMIRSFCSRYRLCHQTHFSPELYSSYLTLSFPHLFSSL